jgi:hypothetical protein
MPNRRSKHTRRTKAQWSKIVERFDLSDQDPRQFCQREGVALSSLQRWRRQLGAVAQREKFVELVPTSSPSTADPTVPQANWSLDVSLPNGVCLRFQG